jgi:hypothetical protein
VEGIEAGSDRSASLRVGDGYQPGFRLGNRVFAAAKNPVSKAETGLAHLTTDYV